MNFVKVILISGWLLMYVIWFFSDPRSFRERVGLYLTIRPLIYGIVLVVVWLVSIIGAEKFYRPSTNFDSFFMYWGLCLFIYGLGVAIWAKFTMKASWGIPYQHNIKTQKHLIKNGSFEYSRNPIYLGLIFMFFGFFIALKSLLIIFAFLGAYYFYKAAIREEKLLEKHFGKQQRDLAEDIYVARLPWRTLWQLQQE